MRRGRAQLLPGGDGQCALTWSSHVQNAGTYNLEMLTFKFGAKCCFEFVKLRVKRVRLSCARCSHLHLLLGGDGQCAGIQH